MRYIDPHDRTDCGISCIRMIAKFYGKDYSSQYLRKFSFLTKQGANLANLGNAAECIGFKVLIGELSLKYLLEKAHLPCVLHWNNNHFVVLYKIRKIKRGVRSGQHIFYIADPGVGKVQLSESVFISYWLSESSRGLGLFMEPTTVFFEHTELHEPGYKEKKKSTIRFLGLYLRRYSKSYFQVAIAMIFASIILVLIPLLTQGIVDSGVQRGDANLVFILVVFQVILFMSNTFAEFIRTHLLVHIGGRISMSVVSDFLTKLFKLPLSFFESKMPGDIMQRVNDNQRIEDFITTSLLTTFFSAITMAVFSAMLFGYSAKLFLFFAIGSICSVGWTLFFNNARKSLDYVRFQGNADASDKMYELINGMPEIKLNQFSECKKLDWQELQVKQFNIHLRTIRLDQYQKIGSSLITQIKNAVITYIAATSVIEGNMTLGMMLAISYINGQLNAPLTQFIELTTSYQFTKISIERMNEVYAEKEEENEQLLPPTKHMNKERFGIELQNVSFQYEGRHSDFVLKDISLKIPKGKITAIVGTSGSGKTTLLKLILRFFEPTQGSILLDGKNFSQISPSWWRSRCGTVLQDGYLFSDSISRNIVMGHESGHIESIIHACEIASIDDFIADLPGNFDTKIGASGVGVSAGQKQRILIARAVYKNPDFLFFDEATSSLDTKNEATIMRNLEEFLSGKTVLIVAHRLSTVRNADQIIVMDKGKVVEVGTHDDLVTNCGHYFNLIKNQLELGV